MKVTLRRSLIGVRGTHKATVHALGFRKRGQVRELVDSPDVRGMLNKVSYLVEVEGEEQ